METPATFLSPTVNGCVAHNESAALPPSGYATSDAFSVYCPGATAGNTNVPSVSVTAARTPEPRMFVDDREASSAPLDGTNRTLIPAGDPPGFVRTPDTRTPGMNRIATSTPARASPDPSATTDASVALTDPGANVFAYISNRPSGAIGVAGPACCNT